MGIGKLSGKQLGVPLLLLDGMLVHHSTGNHGSPMYLAHSKVNACRKLGIDKHDFVKNEETIYQGRQLFS